MDPADPAKRGTLTQQLEAQNRHGLAQEAARAQGQDAVLNAMRHQWNPHLT